MNQHQQGQSAVSVNVSYKDNVISIVLEDDEGKAPALALSHEKEMHFLMVSNDLKQYYHLHPEKAREGVYTIEQHLDAGTYTAFVDITPDQKAYEVSPHTVQVGTSKTDKINLEPEQEWTKNVDGQIVTLEHVRAKTDAHVPLAFNTHGVTPETYLGALGHVVIVDNAVEEYIHVHPESDDTTTFHAHFPKAGMYKIWAEFKFNGAVHTYAFIIEVIE